MFSRVGSGRQEGDFFSFITKTPGSFSLIVVSSIKHSQDLSIFFSWLDISRNGRVEVCILVIKIEFA